MTQEDQYLFVGCALRLIVTMAIPMRKEMRANIRAAIYRNVAGLNDEQRKALVDYINGTYADWRYLLTKNEIAALRDYIASLCADSQLPALEAAC